METTNCRRASEAPFPYMSRRVCFFSDGPNGPRPLRSAGDFREVVPQAVAGEVQIYAAWPGSYTTDLFVIDQPELLAAARKIS